MERTLSAGLAKIVTELELEQPTLVSLADLAILAEAAHVASAPFVVADRLRRRGWLLPTGQRGIYEFAPAAHAGPYGHGDPFITFRAAQESRRFEATVALESALWLNGLADRAPNQHVISADAAVAIPKSVRSSMRVVRHLGRLDPIEIDRLPVQRVETMLVHLATKPSAVRDWPAILDALPDLVSRSQHRSLIMELTGRPRAVTTRLVYLLAGVAPDLAEALQPEPSAGVVYFGPRRESRRFNARFNVADTVLPLDPTTLAEVKP